MYIGQSIGNLDLSYEEIIPIIGAIVKNSTINKIYFSINKHSKYGKIGGRLKENVVDELEKMIIEKENLEELHFSIDILFKK